MTSSAVNLVMTVIGFTVSTIFIVFVCTRLICARIQYLAWRRSSAYTSRSDLSIDITGSSRGSSLLQICKLERGLHGLEPLAVANFPTKKYSDAFFTFAEDTQIDENQSNGFLLFNENNELFTNREGCGNELAFARCTICLAEYRKEDTLRILPSCGHYFHATCIDIWFQQQSTCPVCRISLREAAEKKCFMQPLFSSAVRSQYAMDSLDVDTNQCSSSGPRFSSR
ncbi:putative ribosome biogenesis protein TSR3 -like protein [Capsicum annuum]|nr:putative ribosome biogenesis protein TSR3 -like protein [Capsicum annuum]